MGHAGDPERMGRVFLRGWDHIKHRVRNCDVLRAADGRPDRRRDALANHASAQDLLLIASREDERQKAASLDRSDAFFISIDMIIL